jgi:hypothetical protein
MMEDVDIGGYRRLMVFLASYALFFLASEVAYSRTTGHTTAFLLSGWISYHCLQGGWMDWLSDDTSNGDRDMAIQKQ